MITCSASLVKPQALFGKKTKQPEKSQSKSKQQPKPSVNYGNDWYAKTRDPNEGRSVRQEIERRKKANFEANNGKERKDLYTDNWDGDKYKGSPVNVLSIIAAVSILAPLIGLVFAYQSYGVYWG